MSTAVKIGLWLLKNWKLVLIAAVVVALVSYVGYLRYSEIEARQAAAEAIQQRDLQTSLALSAIQAIESMKAHEEAQAKARQAVKTAKVSRDTKVKVIEQENHHAPGNDTAAGPSWDALGDRLRELAADAKD